MYVWSWNLYKVKNNHTQMYHTHKLGKLKFLHKYILGILFDVYVCITAIIFV